MGCRRSSFAQNTLEPSIYLINQHLLNAYEVPNNTWSAEGNTKRKKGGNGVSIPREHINFFFLTVHFLGWLNISMNVAWAVFKKLVLHDDFQLRHMWLVVI